MISRCSSPIPAIDDLVGLLVGLDPESRVLAHQLRQADAELLLVALGLGLDRQRDDGLGKSIDSSTMEALLVAQRVAGADLLQADGGRQCRRRRPP
jgi:hypothetical protein